MASYFSLQAHAHSFAATLSFMYHWTIPY